jgi:secreted trypsin-like serine protease
LKYLALFLSLLSVQTFASNNQTNILPVYGGTMVKSSEAIAQSTVAIVDDDTVICTGTVIETDMVLTAAHCLSSWLPTIRFATNALSDVVPHRKALNQKAAGNADIALIYFGDGLPENYKAAKLPIKNYVIAPQTQLLVAGYGTTVPSPKNVGIGILRKTILPVLEIIDGVNVVRLDQSGSSGVCYGDSGGPLYQQLYDDELLLLGVADKVETKNCKGSSYYARVSQYLQWISDTEAELRSRN